MTGTPPKGYKQSYLKVLTCDDDDRRVLESLRFRDQDLSIKCGAMLAFSALLIACALVVLSAAPDSHLYTPPGSTAALAAWGSAWAGILSAGLAAAAIVRGRSGYSDKAVDAINEYEEVLTRKAGLLLFAVIVSFLQLLGLVVSLAPFCR